jgi:hypothetical protein
VYSKDSNEHEVGNLCAVYYEITNTAATDNTVEYARMLLSAYSQIYYSSFLALVYVFSLLF